MLSMLYSVSGVADSLMWHIVRILFSNVGSTDLLECGFLVSEFIGAFKLSVAKGFYRFLELKEHEARRTSYFGLPLPII